jgi:hypothetical protein
MKSLLCVVGLHRYGIVDDDSAEFLKPQHEECTRCGKAREIVPEKPVPDDHQLGPSAA